MTFRLTAAIVFALLPMACADNDADKVRIACVGDSITYGATLRDRQDECYPAQLGRMLGPKYRVRNFGVSGTTLLSKGDGPYIETDAYKSVKEFTPNIIIIMLGTNDTKPWNWRHEADFVSDYKAMIQELSALESKPKIWLCTPVPANPGDFGIEEARIRTGVVPKVKEIAKSTGLPMIDLYQALGGKPNLFSDKVHLNAAGAALVARIVYQALRDKNGAE
jgi:lysophospholipase L1-like esterase